MFGVVPSLRGKEVVEERREEGDEDVAWISTAIAATQGADEDVADIDDDDKEEEEDVAVGLGELRLEEERPLESLPHDAEGEEDIPDVDDFDGADNLVIIDDPCEFKAPTKPPSPSSKILLTRTFDLSITYDKYYQTPRLWLCGYDEHSTLLPPSRLFDDISTEHARRTVTIETHPSLGMAMASVHPCRHAHVMRKIVGFMRGDGREVRVDQYLVIFLKFISTVFPTIDYDHTMSLD